MLTYNRADVLPRSLDTLLDQTYENFELIINDDQSTDHTEEVGRAYEKQDDRVQYVRNERNRKYAGNNNAAIERASGKYVGLVHDGDLYEPFMVERWVEALETYPSAALAFHSHYGDEGEPRIHEFPALIDGHDLLDEVMLRQFGSPIYGIAMVRKRCVEAVGPFDTSFPRQSDVDMWMRLLNEYNAAYVDEPLAVYAPREEDHELTGVNWEATEEIAGIRRVNIQHRFANDSEARREYMQLFERDLEKRYLRDIGWCLKRSRWGLAREGAERAQKADSLRLRWIGKVIAPVLELFERAVGK